MAKTPAMSDARSESVAELARQHKLALEATPVPESDQHGGRLPGTPLAVSGYPLYPLSSTHLAVCSNKLPARDDASGEVSRRWMRWAV